ncbi:signal peptidase I [Lacrimispora sp. NSJ-141]|uniref:Signal peptidase I n=1 Tax=Lientehia hominis TaxID=2897778 RepID=A0AAP2RJN3_9FIRM|nr:signal peptidase I [Lientehia hominis]MCD2492648.1 signal peptidase I [Lientehia hominis]
MRSYYQDNGAGQGRLKTLLSWGVDIVAVITLALFVVMMFGTKITMSGRSMEPTLQTGDVVLLDKLWYNFTKPKRMDVVAFQNMGDDTKTYIKRIVGLPGETVQIQGGKLYVNGEEAELGEKVGAIALPGLAETAVELKKDEYFVLGDNPETSEDSRFANVGNVHISQIRGKLWLRMSPFSRFGFIK